MNIYIYRQKEQLVGLRVPPGSGVVGQSVRESRLQKYSLLLSFQKCQGVPFSPICQNELLPQRPH